MSSAVYSNAASSSASSTAAIHSTVSHFRRLAWQSSLTVRVRLAHPSVLSSELNSYYVRLGCLTQRELMGVQMQVPRYSYLALLVPELRDNFVKVLLSAQARASLNESDWWFEHDTAPDAEGTTPTAPAPSLGACRWSVS